MLCERYLGWISEADLQRFCAEIETPVSTPKVLKTASGCRQDVFLVSHLNSKAA